MVRERDSQRKRVYQWQHRHAMEHSLYMERLSMEGCRALVDAVVQDYLGPYAQLPEVVRVAGREASGSRYRITLPRWAQTAWTVLHEVSHTIRSETSSPAHGPGFVRLHIELCTRYMGLSRRALVKGALRYGVRIGSEAGLIQPKLKEEPAMAKKAKEEKPKVKARRNGAFPEKAGDAILAAVSTDDGYGLYRRKKDGKYAILAAKGRAKATVDPKEVRTFKSDKGKPGAFPKTPSGKWRWIAGARPWDEGVKVDAELTEAAGVSAKKATKTKKSDTKTAKKERKAKAEKSVLEGAAIAPSGSSKVAGRTGQACIDCGVNVAELEHWHSVMDASASAGASDICCPCAMRRGGHCDY